MHNPLAPARSGAALTALVERCTRLTRLGAAAVAALALASCGTGAAAQRHATSASTNHATVPSPTSTTTTSGTATVRQYASIVARDRIGLDRYLPVLLGPSCLWFAPGSVDESATGHDCVGDSLGAAFSAHILSSALSGAQKPGVPAYVGAVPDEVQPITAQTVRDADKVADLRREDKVGDCIVSDHSGCANLLNGWSTDLTNLSADLAAWAPYGAGGQR